MSSSHTAAVDNPIAFAEGVSGLNERALFNPFPAQRKQALIASRQASPFSAAQWARFDLAAGLRSREWVDEHKQELEADTTMPVNSWLEYSDEVTTDHEKAPNTLQYLIDQGYTSSSTLARYAHIRPQSSGQTEAEVNMNARARSRQDLPTYGLDGVALPIVHSDWEIDSREYQQSQAFGEDLDARVAMDAREAIEDKEDVLLFDGWSGSVETRDGPFSVRGFDSSLDQVLTGTASGDWGTESNVIDTLEEFQRQIEGQGADGENPSPRQTGATVLVPTEQMTEVSLGDYETSATDEPLMDRLERKFPYLTFQEAPRLPAGDVIYMLNDTRYFEVVVAQGMTSTSWEVDGGFGRRSKMLASRIPWVKDQPDDIYGIARYSGA
jgi:hypothetical protein